MAETYLEVEADVTTGMWTRGRRRLIWWLVGKWTALATLLLIVTAGVLWFYSGLSIGSVIVSISAAYSVFVVALLVFVTPRSRRPDALTEGHFRFVARDDGYTISGPFGEQHLKWSTFKMAWVDSTYIYLFVSNRAAQLIPLSLVRDPAPMINHLRSAGLLRPVPKMFFVF